MQNPHTYFEKIREISKFPELPTLSDNLIAGLTELCFYRKTIPAPDIIFVFGSNILHQEIGQQLSELLNKFQVPRVIITGGIANYNSSFYEPIAESELIFKNVPDNDFPNTCFIIENKSTHTLENVDYARALYDFSKAKKITFISHSYSSMRAYLSLKKYCNKTEIGYYPVKVPTDIPNISIDLDNWFETSHGKKLVWGNI
ncbi:MAG: YdcF family protein [Sphingobacterium sp.]|jgi:uncharacterized SAM-binding protein YcdF (DUF218 family)|nr:YdcF family protein [Sphingobacterium sp.]